MIINSAMTLYPYFYVTLVTKYFFFTGEAMRRGQWPDIFGAVSAFFTTQKYTNSQIPQIQNEITGRQEQ